MSRVCYFTGKRTVAGRSIARRGKEGNRDEALKELRRALELDPNSAKIRNVLETVLRRRD